MSRDGSGLSERVAQSIGKRCLFRRGQSILVAVSGGVDSVVLLEVLHRLAPRERWKLTVAHLNHRLRGRSSDADERLVRRLAARLRLPLVVERANVRALAQREGVSTEMAARKLRHDFLARTAARLRIPSAGLAHHADDQLELFFLRLLRGAGTEGLAGMKWSNASPADPGIRLVRPLLGEPKGALCDYAREQGLPFREDATNASLDIPRNRIRHELLPLLRQHYQPALDRTVLRLMEQLGPESELVRRAASEWLEGLFPTATRSPKGGARTPLNARLSAKRPAPSRGGQSRGAARSAGPATARQAFRALPVAVQRCCLHLQLLGLGVAPDFGLVEALRSEDGRPICVSAGAVVRDTAGRVWLHEPTPVKLATEGLNLELKGRAGKVRFGGTEIGWERLGKGRARLRWGRAGQECFDADRVGGTITLRHWRPGDRFQPIGLRTSVKLQDIFTNQKVPRARRHELVLAESRKAGIFWVEGLRIGEQFKLTDRTIRRLQWRWERL